MDRPLDYTDYDTRLAAYAVIVEERDGVECVLLALWNERRPRWTLPGGGVDFAETPADGAVREVCEESGYDVELGRLLGVDVGTTDAAHRLYPNGRAMKQVRVLYEARVTGGELTREVDGSTDEARWWPLGDVAGLARVAMVDVALSMRSEAGPGNNRGAVPVESDRT